MMQENCVNLIGDDDTLKTGPDVSDNQIRVTSAGNSKTLKLVHWLSNPLFLLSFNDGR
jgi:hypothetical protein